MLQSRQEEYRRFFRVFQGAADKRFLRTPCIAAALHSDNRYPLDRQRTSDPGKHHTNLKPRGWHAGKQGTKNRMQMAVTARHEHFTPPAFQASPMFHARVSPRIMHAAAMASRSSPGVMEERETTVRHHPRHASNTHTSSHQLRSGKGRTTPCASSSDFNRDHWNQGPGSSLRPGATSLCPAM